MFIKKNTNLCKNCKTGRKTYELDEHSEFCPYIDCYDDDTCPFYRPINAIGYKKQKKRNLLKEVIGFFKK